MKKGVKDSLSSFSSTVSSGIIVVDFTHKGSKRVDGEFISSENQEFF